MLKEKLTKAQVLTTIDPTQSFSSHIHFRIRTGSSTLPGNEERQVLVYSSRCLNVPEKNYGISKLEALAIIWAIKKNRNYLLGRHFKIVTDHSVCSLKKIKDLKGKLGRWMLEMAEHQYEFTRVESFTWMPMHYQMPTSSEAGGSGTTHVRNSGYGQN